MVFTHCGILSIRNRGPVAKRMDDLISKYIDEKQRPLEADLEQWGIPIWALIGYWKAAKNDVDVVARDYKIPIEAVHAALHYYEKHKDIIDAKLMVNSIAPGLNEVSSNLPNVPKSKYIDEKRPPLEAYLEQWGIPIWPLIGYWKGVNNDVELVVRDYKIPVEAVHAALQYYQKHKDIIDAKLLVNAG